MSKPRLMQTLPSLGPRDHERPSTHRCSYEYSPPKRSDHRSSPEWTNGTQEGRLPSLEPTGRPLYPVNPGSRLQPVHLRKDESCTRGYQSFGGTSDGRPQLPSVRDILKTNSHPQHSYHRPPSDHKVAIEPFERGRSPFPLGVAADERTGPHASPSSNISAPSSTSYELESMGDRPRSEIPKGSSVCRQHTILGSDVGGPFQRHSLCNPNEGGLPPRSGGHRLPVSRRHPPRPYSPEESGGEPASFMAGVDSSRPSATEEEHDRCNLDKHRVLPSDGHDNYERLDHKRMATSSYLCSGREPGGNHHLDSARPATPGIVSRLNQRHDPVEREIFPQLKETFYPQRSVTTTGGHSTHTHAEGESSLIWDGNRFLPRLVRTETVPGKGLCYFYDDGSHCKARIDGEDVNPNWGVTKAGKPRKRLAVACITCREKKIKCDPDYPKCKQCVKFDRVCMFKNA